MIRLSVIACLPVLAACQPPATDEYFERAQLDREAEGPSEPIRSPDTEGAMWAPAASEDRLLYGKPGERPLLALECLNDTVAQVAYTRFVLADPHAKAILALIGNGHVSRLFVDAERNGEAWLWKGTVDAQDTRLDVFTGLREVEATVPGAGSVILNPSPLPGELVERCRARAAPPPSPPADPA